MDRKTKNKRNNLSNGEKEAAVNQHSWPNLPHQLLCLIARKPTLMQNITSFGGVVKSWRSVPRNCSTSKKSPWPKLVKIDTKGSGENRTKARSHVIDIPFHEDYVYSYRRRSYKNWHQAIYFKGYSHGRVISVGHDTSECLLWDPIGQYTTGFPHWDSKVPFQTATLSSQWEYPNWRTNVMVLTGVSSPSFLFCRTGNGEYVWFPENCTLKDPYAPNEIMQFTSAIGFEGKFYALSLQGSLAVIEDVGESFKITRISASRGVPSKLSRQYREFLVEVNGEIMLVFLISRKSIDVVEDVEVFRLDVLKLLWIKVESLGERTLFLEDECCMWVDAREVGCKKNCIYFTHHRVDDWLVCEMENGSILSACGSGAGIREFEKWSEPMEVE